METLRIGIRMIDA